MSVYFSEILTGSCAMEWLATLHKTHRLKYFFLEVQSHGKWGHPLSHSLSEDHPYRGMCGLLWRVVL